MIRFSALSNSSASAWSYTLGLVLLMHETHEHEKLSIFRAM